LPSNLRQTTSEYAYFRLRDKDDSDTMQSVTAENMYHAARKLQGTLIFM